jgi:hypothetical protein
MARQIICKTCSKSVVLYDDSDPHAALQCDCCPEDHHHGVATATTGVPCRPVTHVYIGEMTPPGTAG